MPGIDSMCGLKGRPPEHQSLLLKQPLAQPEAVIGRPISGGKRAKELESVRKLPAIDGRQGLAPAWVAFLTTTSPALDCSTPPGSRFQPATGQQAPAPPTKSTRIVPAITEFREKTALENIIRSTRSARRTCGDTEAIEAGRRDFPPGVARRSRCVSKGSNPH